MAWEKLDCMRYILFNPIGNRAKIQLSAGFLQQCFMKQEIMNLRY